MAANPLALGPLSINANILGSLATPLAGDAAFRRREFLEYARVLAQSSRHIIDQIASSGASGHTGHYPASSSLEETSVGITARRLAAQISQEAMNRRTIPASSPETTLKTYTPSAYSSYAADNSVGRHPGSGVADQTHFEDELQTRLPATHKHHLQEKHSGPVDHQETIGRQTALQDRALYEKAAQRRRDELGHILDQRQALRQRTRLDNRLEKNQRLDEQTHHSEAFRSRRFRAIEDNALLQQQEDHYRREIALLIEDRIAKVRTGNTIADERLADIRATQEEAARSLRQDQAHRDRDHQRDLEETQRDIDDRAYRKEARLQEKREDRIEASAVFGARHIERIEASEAFRSRNIERIEAAHTDHSHASQDRHNRVQYRQPDNVQGPIITAESPMKDDPDPVYHPQTHPVKEISREHQNQNESQSQNQTKTDTHHDAGPQPEIKDISQTGETSSLLIATPPLSRENREASYQNQQEADHGETVQAAPGFPPQVTRNTDHLNTDDLQNFPEFENPQDRAEATGQSARQSDQPEPADREKQPQDQEDRALRVQRRAQREAAETYAARCDADHQRNQERRAEKQAEQRGPITSGIDPMIDPHRELRNPEAPERDFAADPPGQKPAESSPPRLAMEI